jgi:choline monooxygenase
MLNLAPRLYVDTAILERERELIFKRTWQLLAPEAQVAQAGHYVSADIAGFKIFVIGGRDGTLRGFCNICRQRGAQLLEAGTGRCGAIRCPSHQWVFDDHGKLVSAPWFGEDPDFDKSKWPLDPIEVTTWRELLFAVIDPAEDLLTQLGDLVGELADEPIKTYLATNSETVNFESSWKIYTDNFVEGYPACLPNSSRPSISRISRPRRTEDSFA